MKKSIITTLVLLSAYIGTSQDKWRAITLTAINNLSTSGQKNITQLSASLDYQLTDKISISSWNGYGHDFNTNQGWLASQTTLDKSFDEFKVGIGYLYTTGEPLMIPSQNFNDNFYASIKAQYRIKL